MKVEEADGTLRCNSQLLEVKVDTDALDGVVADLSLVELLAWLSGLCGNYTHNT